jgi:hypothetical protein
VLHLPPRIAARYRPATVREVHSLSFGQLKAPRDPEATRWEQRRGTLDDQAIFGPLKDYECVCGKYTGPNYQGMICDRCGVKVTSRAARRQRFGHIDLPGPLVHPLGQGAESVGAIPVLPAAFVESGAGASGLADVYDALVRSALSESGEGLGATFSRLLGVLLPAVTVAHEWDLQEAQLLARGLALAPRVSTAQDSCGRCGYPLEGLEVLFCPGCGQKLRCQAKAERAVAADRAGHWRFRPSCGLPRPAQRLNCAVRPH